MDICLHLVWLICSGHVIFCLPDSYEERRAFVGADLEMRCAGPPTSDIFYIEWRMLSGVKDTLIFVCPSELYGSCEEIDSHILNDQNSYTSSFTIKNVSLEDAGEYLCEIGTSQAIKLCRFNVTLKDCLFKLPLGLIITLSKSRASIRNNVLKVREDINTTIDCQTNNTVPPSANLDWKAEGKLVVYKHQQQYEGDSLNGASSEISFLPMANDNGTLLICMLRVDDTSLENIQTSVILQVEVCVSRLEIFNCNPLDAVINEKSTLSCHTDTDSINHVSSTVSFGIDPMDVTRASAYTNATWGGQGTPYVATYDQEGFVPSNITCCVSKTSLCPAVCSDVCLFDVNVYPPRILHKDTKLISMVDGIFLFHCEVDAVPEATISWSLSRGGLFGNTQFVTINNRTLTIHPPFSNGIGGEKVMCSAENVLGKDTFTITIVADISSRATGLSTVVLICVPWMLVVLLFVIVISLVLRSAMRARTAQASSSSQTRSSSHAPKTPSEQVSDISQTASRSTSGQALGRQVSNVEDQDTCSGYMEMRPIAPGQQYMTLICDGTTLEDELGSYVSPTLTRKHNPTTTEKTFLGDPTYMNTGEVSYVNTIMKKNDDNSHCE